MRILMVVAYFVPEIGSAAHVYFDLARAFIKRGHQVDVITSYPRKLNLDRSNISKDFELDETIEGIEVHRCDHFSKRDNILLRGMEHFLLPIYYFKRYVQLQKKFDACLIYIPPLPLYYFAKLIKAYNGVPSILNYQDFHPQELVDVGVLKSKPIIKFMEYIEKQSYKNADYITVLSEGAIDYVVKRGGNSNKIEHIYNGGDGAIFQNYIDKTFKSKEKIGNNILISYAGILSPFQGIDRILDSARSLIDKDNIVFYIVGDGMAKKEIENRIKLENLHNVKLLPSLPREEYFNLISSSDISIVSLDKRMNAPCLPGKLISLMAVGQPIVALVPQNSETARVIEKAGCGISVNPSDIEKFKISVLEMVNNPRFKTCLGENSRIFFEKNMDLSRIVLKYEDLFKKLVEEKGAYV